MAAGRYDDGRTGIPGGVTAPVDRVLVVGAGIAGLTAANALTRAGVDCLVLEARDRLGGRLHTLDLDGTPVDLGGSWIHHPDGNPMRAFAEQVGIRCDPGNPLATMTGYDLAERRLLARAELDTNLAALLDGFPDAVPQLQDRLGPTATAADGVDAFVAGAGMKPDTGRRARQTLRAVLEADAADQVDRVSLRWLWHEIEYGGDFFGDLPVGGYRSLVDAMADGVAVRLGEDVTEVALADSGVRLRTADGAVHHGSHVVVTVPLGVLKRGAPRFSPGLPADKAAAIERLGFGRYEKVALRFQTAFWRDAGLSHLMLFPAAADQATRFVFDLDAFGAGPVLVAHVFHSATGRVLGGPPEQAGDWLLDQLSEVLGSPCPRPSAVAVTGWAHDPYTGGAYSHVPPEAEPADLDLLGEPVEGRVLFAGEHTQSARVGYADGAMSSGIREAKRLLRRPAVELGPLPAATRAAH